MIVDVPNRHVKDVVGSNVDIIVERTKIKINVCVLSCQHISALNMLLLMFF